MTTARLPTAVAYVAITLCAACDRHEPQSKVATPSTSEHVSPTSTPPTPTPTKPAVDLMEPPDEPADAKVAPPEPSGVVERVNENLAVAKLGRVKADIATIESALAEYAINNSGRYPDSLEPLVTPDVNAATYLGTTEMPRDPWGREYLYEPPGPGTPTPRIYTLGSDNRAGGRGEDADVDNASLREDR